MMFPIIIDRFHGILRMIFSVFPSHCDQKLNEGFATWTGLGNKFVLRFTFSHVYNSIPNRQHRKIVILHQMSIFGPFSAVC